MDMRTFDTFQFRNQNSGNNKNLSFPMSVPTNVKTNVPNLNMRNNQGMNNNLNFQGMIGNNQNNFQNMQMRAPIFNLNNPLRNNMNKINLPMVAQQSENNDGNPNIVDNILAKSQLLNNFF